MIWGDADDDEERPAAAPGSAWPLVVCVVAADVLAVVGALWPWLT